jgi:glyoxylase-like metal-dependent hydrolase (beta-lactamase superfamily II)
LITAAAEAGGQIKRIALTHGHLDHVGSLDGLKDRLGSNVAVSMGELDARILAGEIVEGRLPGSWPKVKTVPDTRLTGGEIVGSLEVVPTPGHSPGHVAFRDTRDGTVIAGDVFTSFWGIAVSNHFSLPFPFAAMATWDQARDLESARAIRALNPSLLVVGHGPATSLPQAAIDAAITRAQRGPLKAIGFRNYLVIPHDTNSSFHGIDLYNVLERKCRRRLARYGVSIAMISRLEA